VVERFRDLSQIKYWLFKTLRREFLRTIRRRKKQFEVEFLPDIHNSPTGDFEPWQRSRIRPRKPPHKQISSFFRCTAKLNLQQRQEIGLNDGPG